MKPAYIEDKDFKDLFTSFSISFGCRTIDVFVWKSVRGLYRNTDFKPKDYLGGYVYYPYRVRRGLFGEVHLVKRMVGAGYVAHELQHFFYDWLKQQNETSATNEKLAYLAGDVTRSFWNEWHKIMK